MKLLFDENLSPKLVAMLDDLFPGSAHVRDHGLKRADDSEVWQFAHLDGYTIVSKDEDFHQRSLLYGPPPKVVWVRTGNCATERVRDVLRGGQQRLAKFDADPGAAFLVLP